MGGHKLPWTHPIIWILFGSSLLSGLLFLVIEAYVAPEPILPLRLLIHRDVMTTNLLAILQSSAQFAVPPQIYHCGGLNSQQHGELIRNRSCLLFPYIFR